MKSSLHLLQQTPCLKNKKLRTLKKINPVFNPVGYMLLLTLTGTCNMVLFLRTNHCSVWRTEPSQLLLQLKDYDNRLLVRQALITF